MAIAERLVNATGSLISAGNFVETTYDKYFVASSTLPEGIQGFAFDVFNDFSVELEAEVTDHYVEDNMYMQDHVAIKPERVSLSGLIGELAMQDQINSIREVINQNELGFGDIFSNEALVDTATQKLGVLTELLPPLSRRDLNAFMEAQDAYRQTTNLLRKGQDLNLYDLFEERVTTTTKQEKALQFFSDCIKNRALLKVVTPYKEYDNMVVERVRASRTESKGVSDFEVSLKRIRIAQTKVTTRKATGKTAIQKAETVNHGIDNGRKVDESEKTALYKLTH